MRSPVGRRVSCAGSRTRCPLLRLLATWCSPGSRLWITNKPLQPSDEQLRIYRRTVCLGEQESPLDCFRKDSQKKAYLTNSALSVPVYMHTPVSLRVRHFWKREVQGRNFSYFFVSKELRFGESKVKNFLLLIIDQFSEAVNTVNVETWKDSDSLIHLLLVERF